MDDFLWRALLGGIGIAIVAGPLGCFIVWQRMAYFGDTLAHSALLGVALGFLFSINLYASIISTCIIVAILLVGLQQQRHLATDTALGILAHSSLALGLVTLSFLDNIRVDLMGYLFGDLLALTQVDLYWIYFGGASILTGLILIWRPLLATTVHKDLAKVEGIKTTQISLMFMIMVAIFVAIAMKIIGILLITSLLIIPTAAARSFARTPEQMAWLASLLGSMAVIGGLALAWYGDTPTAPSIIVVAVGLFAFSLLFNTLLDLRRSL